MITNYSVFKVPTPQSIRKLANKKTAVKQFPETRGRGKLFASLCVFQYVVGQHLLFVFALTLIPYQIPKPMSSPTPAAIVDNPICADYGPIFNF
jgi:hypothetical protein